MINNKVRVLKHGQMVLVMRENIMKGERKVMELFILLMDQNIQGFLLKMKYMDMESMNGRMGEFIREIGNKIK